MSELARGALSKMAAQLDAPVQYSFRLGDELLPVNPLIGKTLRLEYLGAIHARPRAVSVRVTAIPACRSWRSATSAS
jgi:hypothetical protein